MRAGCVCIIAGWNDPIHQHARASACPSVRGAIIFAVYPNIGCPAVSFATALHRGTLAFVATARRGGCKNSMTATGVTISSPCASRHGGGEGGGDVVTRKRGATNRPWSSVPGNASRAVSIPPRSIRAKGMSPKPWEKVWICRRFDNCIRLLPAAMSIFVLTSILLRIYIYNVSRSRSWVVGRLIEYSYT